MLAKTGLLIVSNPSQIHKALSNVKKKVKNTLYIQLLSALSDPFGAFHPNIFNSWPKFSHTISSIYSQAAVECQHLDVRVLLSGLKCHNIKSINTLNTIDLVIFDKKHNRNDIDSFLKSRINNIHNECPFVTFESDNMPLDFNTELPLNRDDKIYKHTVLGGTFDRLHTAHKLLLSEAALRSQSVITVGVTEENMLYSKTLWELIEPIEDRIASVENFLRDICPELTINVVPINDPFGPTQSDPTMELLVVSAETLKGGHKVNEVRSKNKLKDVNVLSVELIDEPHHCPNEETKISSSTFRMRLLGTLLKPVDLSKCALKPYVIGLTGGIASGKSNVSRYLSEFGAEIINCDVIAHELYAPGKKCYNLVVESFGNHILKESGEIDRKILGGIVFGDPAKLKVLNELVWPAIAEEVQNIIKKSDKNVVVIEAAVLLSAGWKNLCHEVWNTIVPKEEAIKRLKSRNNLNEEEARSRINSQESNSYYVKNAHVVLCTLWPFEYTKQQVKNAWELLQLRLPPQASL